MKKFILPSLVTFLIITGCQNTVSNPPTPQQQTPPPVSKIQGYVYPDFDAQVGEKYGQMTVEKMPAKNSGDIYAYFKGDVTLTGQYQYYDDEQAFLAGQICFTITDENQIVKLPQSQTQYQLLLESEKQGQAVSKERFACFSNFEKAIELFGKGKGTATVTISSYDDVISFEGEANSRATLEKVISKTPEATDSPDVIPTIPDNVYPDRQAKVSQKYGGMKFMGWDKEQEYAIFKGNLTLKGNYFYEDKDAPFIPDTVCFQITDKAEMQKLPQSRFFYDMHQLQPGENYLAGFCFRNTAEAKKLLGVGEGTATIIINSYESIISSEGEFNDWANLEKVISKTEQK